jgi:hypothetical protein
LGRAAAAASAVAGSAYVCATPVAGTTGGSATILPVLSSSCTTAAVCGCPMPSKRVRESHMAKLGERRRIAALAYRARRTDFWAMGLRRCFSWGPPLVC